MADKKLYRSRTKKMLGGVCGGLSDFFNMDATLIRLILVALVVFGLGSGILLYLIGWLIIPEEPFYNVS